MSQAVNRPFWTDTLAPYARPRLGRSLLDIVTSIVPYLVLSVVIYNTIGYSVLVALALAIPTAGFLVRTFVVFHDCTHGSLLPSKRANAYVGAVLGLMVLAPFHRWRHDHAVHHASSGDLERRGVGDLPTLTVAEYRARSPRGQFAYRMNRNPLVMFVLGPIVGLAAQCGDLAESMLKRAAGAKSSSDLIPGHGGVLDRVDSFLLAGPVMTLFVLTFLR